MINHKKTEVEGIHGGICRYPEEIGMDIEREKKVIKDYLDAEDAAWFTVFDGERAVGNCSIFVKNSGETVNCFFLSRG